jgi:hypothetical protein
MQCGGGGANRELSSPPCQQMELESFSQTTIGLEPLDMQAAITYFPLPLWQLGMEGTTRCLEASGGERWVEKDGLGHTTQWVMVLAAEHSSIRGNNSHICVTAWYMLPYYYYGMFLPSSLLVVCCLQTCTITRATCKHWFHPHP